MVSCNVGDATSEKETQHTHEFVLSEADSTSADCLNAGLEVMICACGERQETTLEALGHEMRVTMEVKPTCTATGSVDYVCSKCGKREFTNVTELGHNFPEVSFEPSRVIPCSNENCTECLWGESNGIQCRGAAPDLP